MKPNWDLYRHFRRVKLYEALFLSIDQQPDNELARVIYGRVFGRCPSGVILNLENLLFDDPVLLQRFEIAISHIDTSGCFTILERAADLNHIEWIVDLPTVGSWAIGIGWNIPPQFPRDTGLIENLSQPSSTKNKRQRKPGRLSFNLSQSTQEPRKKRDNFEFVDCNSFSPPTTICSNSFAITSPPDHLANYHRETNDLRPSESQKIQFLRLKEVLTRTGLKRSSIYKKISEGSFPKPIKLSSRSVAWQEHQINEWLAAQIRQERMRF